MRFGWAALVIAAGVLPVGCGGGAAPTYNDGYAAGVADAEQIITQCENEVAASSDVPVAQRGPDWQLGTILGCRGATALTLRWRAEQAQARHGQGRCVLKGGAGTADCYATWPPAPGQSPAGTEPVQ